MIRFFRDAAIGRKVRKAASGILEHQRVVGIAPDAVIPWSTAAGEFEIVVRIRQQ